MATTYDELVRKIRQSGLQVSNADLQRALVDQSYANRSMQNAKDYANAATPQAAALAQVNQQALSNSTPTSFGNSTTDPVQTDINNATGYGSVTATGGAEQFEGRDWSANPWNVNDIQAYSGLSQQDFDNLSTWQRTGLIDQFLTATGQSGISVPGGGSGTTPQYVWNPTGDVTSGGHAIYSNSSGQTGYEDNSGNWHTVTDLGNGRIREELSNYSTSTGGNYYIDPTTGRRIKGNPTSATTGATVTVPTSAVTGNQPVYKSTVGDAPTYTPGYGEMPTYDASSAGERPIYEQNPQYRQMIDDLVGQIVGWQDYESPYADRIREELDRIIGYGDYSSPYAQQIADLVEAITGRDPFSYDYETDPAWQAYKKQYTREGQRASQDAMANAAMMTGGVPSTAAMTAAQQMNNYYNAQMSDKIPELYQLAYQRYADEGNRMLNNLSALQGLDQSEYGRWADQYNRYLQNLGALQGLDQTEYGRYADNFNRALTQLGAVQGLENEDYNRYRDTVGDWENDRNFGYNQYLDQLSQWNTDRNFDYNQYLDQLGQWNTNRNFEYNQYLDALNQYNADRDYNFDVYRDARNFEYDKSRDQIGDSRYNQEYADSRNDLSYNRAWDEAITAAKYGDYSKLEALGVTPDMAMLMGGTGGGGGGSKRTTTTTPTDTPRLTISDSEWGRIYTEANQDPQKALANLQKYWNNLSDVQRHLLATIGGINEKDLFKYGGIQNVDPNEIADYAGLLYPQPLTEEEFKADPNLVIKYGNYQNYKNGKEATSTNGGYGTNYSNLYQRARTIMNSADNSLSDKEEKKKQAKALLDSASESELTDAGMAYIIQALGLN